MQQTNATKGLRRERVGTRPGRFHPILSSIANAQAQESPHLAEAELALDVIDNRSRS